MSVSIMVVEDNDSIRAGYKNLLVEEARQTFSTEVFVEDFANSDRAVKRLLDQSKVTFDLFFTDIDLTGSPNPDKAGVAFAKFIKSTLPDVPVIGCSGYFNKDDLNPDEIRYFDKWWPKGSSFADLDKMLKNAIQLAIDCNKRRLGFSQMLSINSPEITIDTPESDEQFYTAGYHQYNMHPSLENEFVKPFSVWVRESEEGCEIEVVGCPALIAWGDDQGQAFEVLEELIEGYRELLNVPDESLSSSMQKARAFIRAIASSNCLNS